MQSVSEDSDTVGGPVILTWRRGSCGLERPFNRVLSSATFIPLSIPGPLREMRGTQITHLRPASSGLSGISRVRCSISLWPSMNLPHVSESFRDSSSLSLVRFSCS